MTAHNDRWAGDLWERANSVNHLMEKRATGELPEMEASIYLAKLVGESFAEGETLLDAGSGPGHFLRSFKFLPEKDYTGIDISPALVEAGKRYFPEAEFLVGAVEGLSDLGRKFDHVVCSNVLPHVEQLVPALRSLAAVTRRRLYLRTMIGDQTLLIRHVHNRNGFGGITDIEPSDEIDEANVPREYHNFNIYSRDIVARFLRDFGARKVDIFDDVYFDPNKIASEKNASPRATRIVDGRMVAHNIICPWSYAIADF